MIENLGMCEPPIAYRRNLTKANRFIGGMSAQLFANPTSANHDAGLTVAARQDAKSTSVEVSNDNRNQAHSIFRSVRTPGVGPIGDSERE